MNKCNEELKELASYPEMSPSDFRKKIEEYKIQTDAIDKLVDDAYGVQKVLKTLSLRISRAQLYLKGCVYGGLVKEDMEKLKDIDKELK